MAPENTERNPHDADGSCPDEDGSLPEDSTWGVGSSTAMQTLVKREQRRASSRPADERPSGE